jgi:hypothetical protein
MVDSFRQQSYTVLRALSVLVCYYAGGREFGRTIGAQETGTEENRTRVGV